MKLYGKYIAANDLRPAGYTGLFRGTVVDDFGNKVGEHSAADYFLKLQDPAEKPLQEGDLNFDTWDIIYEQMNNFVRKYMPQMSSTYRYQYGFGGDESDGIIDFFCEHQIGELPDMHFSVYGKYYKIVWNYIEDEADDPAIFDDC